MTFCALGNSSPLLREDFFVDPLDVGGTSTGASLGFVKVLFCLRCLVQDLSFKTCFWGVRNQDLTPALIRVWSAKTKWVPTISDRIRSFLSINITDETILSKLKSVQGSIDLSAAKLKLVEVDNIHFTLRFFGDVTLSQKEEIQGCLDELVFEEFSVEISEVGAFPNLHRPRVVWIGVGKNEDRIITLKKRIDDLLKTVGFSPEKKRFTPHATIARIRRVDDREKLTANLQSLSRAELGSMLITSVSLMKSTLTPRGPIYEVMWSKEATPS